MPRRCFNIANNFILALLQTLVFDNPPWHLIQTRHQTPKVGHRFIFLYDSHIIALSANQPKFIGLKNERNVCHLNIGIQQIYFIPKLREIIFEAKATDAEDDNEKKLLEELKGVLTKLRGSETPVDSTGLLEAINQATLEGQDDEEHSDEGQKEEATKRAAPDIQKDAVETFENMFSPFEVYTESSSVFGNKFIELFETKLIDTTNQQCFVYRFDLGLSDSEEVQTVRIVFEEASLNSVFLVDQLISQHYKTFHKLSPVLMIKLMRVNGSQKKNDRYVTFRLKSSGSFQQGK